MPKSHSTPDQVRNDIDRGRTQDKVDFPDFAAAPLGTDEEAAGTVLSPAAVDAARAQEAGRISEPANPPALERNPSRANLLVITGGTAALALVLLAVF